MKQIKLNHKYGDFSKTVPYFQYSNGLTRHVFLIGRLAFKLPRINSSMKYFLVGAYANWMERNFYKFNAKHNNPDTKLVVESIFCMWFGLVQIQYRCEKLNRELTDTEKVLFKSIANNDLHKDNFGYYYGSIVCFDYGVGINPYNY